MRRLSTALPCALICNFLLEVDESEAFVSKSGIFLLSQRRNVAAHRRASGSQDDTTDASSTATSINPEEAMRKAFARLSILTTEDVQLFGVEENGRENDDEAALIQSFFRKLDAKWEQPFGLDVEDEGEEEEDEGDGADEEESDEPQLWLPGGQAAQRQIISNQQDDNATYEISDAMKDYEETFSTLQKGIANDNESSSVLNAYVRDDDYTPTSKADSDLSKRRENDDVSILIPEPNPQADRDAVSLAGVPYQKVLSGLVSLFPPQDLSLRNAASRRDGYWEFISKGEEPPQQFTYGEFDFYFFGELLDRARYYYTGDAESEGSDASWDGMVFTDVGAGAGRLVFAAAALHPGFKLCRGLEILPSIHQVAEANLEKCRISKKDATTFSSSNDDIAKTGTTPLWQIPKQTDVDWLESFSGSLFGIGGAQNGGEISDGCKEMDDEEEWSNPDDWASSYESSGSNSDTDDDDDDDDWENPDKFLQQFSDEPESEKTSQDIAPSDAKTEDDEYFLACPPISEDGSIILEVEELQQTQLLPLAPIEFNCGSFDDPYEYFGDSDVIFVFSSCMSQDLMSSLSMAIGRQCKPGSIIITTEFPLPLEGYIGPHRCSVDDDIASSFARQDHDLPTGTYKLELLESVDGWVWLTGGESTAYIHRVVESLWEEGVGKRERPTPSAHQTAREIVEAIRCEDLVSTEDFLREVRNKILFLNELPDEWRVERTTVNEDEEEQSNAHKEVIFF